MDRRIPYENILREKHPLIREKVDPLEILPDIDLSTYDQQIIERATKNEGNQRGVDKLVDCVRRRDVNCFITFVRALYKHKYHDIAYEIVRYGGIDLHLIYPDQANNRINYPSSVDSAAGLVHNIYQSQLMLENDVSSAKCQAVPAGPPQSTTYQNIYQRQPPTTAEQLVSVDGQQVQRPLQPPLQSSPNIQQAYQHQGANPGPLQFTTNIQHQYPISHTGDARSADGDTGATAQISDQQAPAMGAYAGAMNSPANRRQIIQTVGTNVGRQASVPAPSDSSIGTGPITEQLLSQQRLPPRTEQPQLAPPRTLAKQPKQEPVMPPRIEYAQPHQGMPPSTSGQNSVTGALSLEQNASRRDENRHRDFKLEEVEDKVLKKWEKRLSEKDIKVLRDMGSEAGFKRKEIRELEKVKPEERGRYVLDKLLDNDSDYTIGQLLELLTDIPDVLNMVLDDMDKINIPSGQNNLNGSTHDNELGPDTSIEYNIQQEINTDQSTENDFPCCKLDSLDMSVSIKDDIDTSGEDNSRNEQDFATNSDQIKMCKVAVENKEDYYYSEPDNGTSLCKEVRKENDQEHKPIQAQSDSANRMPECSLEMAAKDLHKAVYTKKCESMESIGSCRNGAEIADQLDGECSNTWSKTSEEKQNHKITCSINKDDNGSVCSSMKEGIQTNVTAGMQSSAPLGDNNPVIDESGAPLNHENAVIQMPSDKSWDGYQRNDFKAPDLDSLIVEDVEPNEEKNKRLDDQCTSTLDDNHSEMSGPREERITSPVKAEGDPDCKVSEKPPEQDCQRFNIEINNQPNMNSFRDIQNSIPDHNVRNPQNVSSTQNPVAQSAQPPGAQTSLPDEDIIDSQLDIEQNMARLQQDQTFLKETQLQ